MQEYIGQVIGIIATVFTVLSYQANTKKTVLLVQSIATTCICISYFLLGASSGFVLNIVCLIRNVVYYFQREGTRWSYCSAALLAVLISVIGVFSWQGPVSLLIIIALAINTVFLSLGKPQLLRKSILLTSTMILAYNIFIFTVGGILNECLAIASSIVGIVRFCRTVHENEPKDGD